ncbi:MAG TPA: hypothetical protein VLA19_33505 [Herpetosiphonaceae bacterium]|nr:hypothetical protein [Herpetosiphonaceae bacterium]
MTTDGAHTYAHQSPPRRYSSFLLRCWHVGEGELRIKIEHIQSGDSTQVDTYEAAVAWLSEQCARTAVDPPAPSGQPSRVDGEPR